MPPGALAEPLSTAARRGILALVIFFHVGGGWALTQVEPVKLVVGDIAPMEVRMVPAEAPAQIEIEESEPPPPPPVELKPPPPELATIVEPPPDEPPPPEIPPPEKKVEPKPRPPEPKPVQRTPQPARPAAPVEAGPQQAAAPAAPRTVQASQLGWLVQPNPAYPTRSRRAGEQGTATIRVLVDVTGRPAQVSLAASSGHADLDQAALSAVRAAQFRPHMEGGLAQAVWVHIPIKFVLQ
jgi:protein TonB